LSGFGRSTPRSWKRGIAKAVRTTRDDEVDMEAEARRFQKLAPVLGFCACGVSVDEAKGKLHERDCPHLPAERRRA
jgi:hypothetical protein